MTAQTAQQRGAWARHGATYWATFQRIPSLPIVFGSHYGVRVDCATDCNLAHGHVWTSEDGARARLAILPTHYDSGAPIAWELGRVLHHVGGYFYDVVSLELAQLRPGHRVNVGTIDGGDYWQTIASIEFHSRARARGSEVYAVTWLEVIATDPNAAPSLLTSRFGPYDVVTLP